MFFGCRAKSYTEDVQQDIDARNLVQFPVLNKESFIDLIIDLFAKGNDDNIKLEIVEGTSHDLPKTLRHWSHKNHPLILLQEAQTNDELICNGCIQPITGFHQNIYYACIGCNYFLHKFCAELPGKLAAGAFSRHSEHPLVLYHNINKFYIVKCNACGLLTNGFFYQCVECDIRFDMVCCFLPNSIKHESHHHPLNYSAPSKSLICDACGYVRIGVELFKCESSSCSGYQIHKSCVLYPSQLRHRWDPHPISLIYPPFFHQGQIYCEICEEEINPNNWLYHCRECDQSFHTDCIRPYHNAKVGDEVIVDLHEHALTYVHKRKRLYPRPFMCSVCSQDLGTVRTVFECANCDILICRACVCSKM